MPIIFQKMIYREDLKNNPDILYLFGDNEQRRGLAGQAKECRGEPNSIGVRTKKYPSMGFDSFWSDIHYDESCFMIDCDLEPVFRHVNSGRIVVCPSDGIGTGLSDLPNKAPKTFEYIKRRICDLERVARHG